MTDSQVKRIRGDSADEQCVIAQALQLGHLQEGLAGPAYHNEGEKACWGWGGGRPGVQKP